MKVLIGMALAVICMVSVPLKAETVSKGDLVDAIAAEAGMTKAEASKALNAFIVAVSYSLKKEDTVKLQEG